MNGKRNSFVRSLLVLISIIVIFLEIKSSVEAIDHEKNVMSNLRFVDEIDGKEVSFSAWEASREGMYYLVLPSMYLEHDFNVKVKYEDRFYSIYIDDEEYRNDNVWEDPLKEEVHWLKLVDFTGKVHMEKPFQILVSEKIPAIMVTVDAKKELYNHKEYANKQYVEKGNIVMLDERGKIVLDESMERFKVRGNLTSSFAKKPFTFTLPHSISLCGMNESQNWHLLANATDGSHIRNQIMLDWAEEISDVYQPDGEFVDLYVNGEYQGLYFLTETLEISEKRLNIDNFNSILMEMELDYRALEEDNCVVTEQGHYWVIHKDTPVSKTKLNKIELYLNDIESALFSVDGISDISGKKINELLDFDSWTDTWLLKEISSDHDLGTTSQFGVVNDWENRSILIAGPEWDFDGTFGNGMVPWSINPRNLVTAIPNTKGIKSVSQNKWLAQMYHHDNFKEILVYKFVEEVQPKIVRLLDYEIDDYAEKIRRAALLDSVRWNGNGICEYFEYPPDFALGVAEDYRKYDVLDCHIDMIKNFLKEKEQFLQELWVDDVEFEVLIEEHNEPGMNLELNNDIYTWIRKEN